MTNPYEKRYAQMYADVYMAMLTNPFALHHEADTSELENKLKQMLDEFGAAAYEYANWELQQ